MTNVILHKRSSAPAATPTPEQLALGELALNTADGTGFIKTAAGEIVDIRRPILCDGGEIVAVVAGPARSLWNVETREPVYHWSN
jgi:hypothetical protein